jgi:hypothetical protein
MGLAGLWIAFSWQTEGAFLILPVRILRAEIVLEESVQGVFRLWVQAALTLAQGFQSNHLVSCSVISLWLLMYFGIISTMGATGLDKQISFNVGNLPERGWQLLSSTISAFPLILHGSFQEILQMQARLAFCNVSWQLWDFYNSKIKFS